MAKKVKETTIEEKLQNALVPDWEWPYKLPENWCWTRLGELAIDMADGPFGSNLKKEHYTEEKQVRIIQLSNIGEEGWRDNNTKYTTFEHVKTISRSVVDKGDIVIAKMMPAGRAIIVPNTEDMYVLSSDAVKLKPSKSVDISFLVKGINTTFFQNQVQENTQGITRARTSITKLKSYAFPLPPLAEQNRIVDRIESLFAKLDEAKELAQNALDSFENRKSAILHKAFTGELTKKWREENGVSFDSWEETTLDKSAEIVSGFAFDSKSFTADKEIPCVKITNVGVGEFISDSIAYLSQDFIANHIKFIVRQGDILISLTRSYINAGLKVCIYPNEQKALLNQRVASLSSDCSKFIYYHLRTELSLNYVKEKSKTTNQPNLSINDLKQMAVNLPTLPEQQEIVRILDSIFAKETEAKELASVIDKIDLIKKSILSKAFRGELGTNNATEESSVRLLKEILLDTLNTKEIKPVKNQNSTKEDKRVALPMIEALKSNGKLQPEELKKITELDIDDFYDEIKLLIESNQITEKRVNDIVYLEVTKNES